MRTEIPVKQSAHKWLWENGRLKAAALLAMTKFALVERISTTLLLMPEAARVTREHIEHFAASQDVFTAERVRQYAQVQLNALPRRYNNHQFWPDV
jgi:hypothetical protein